MQAHKSFAEWKAAGAAFNLTVRQTQGFQRYELVDVYGEVHGLWNGESGTFNLAHNVQPIGDTHA